jgi:predicted ATPase
VSDVAPDELPRLPLLNDILAVGLPDTELTATLDPAQRQQSLVILLVHLLRTWTAERPLLLILEDAQWLDSLSWELTTQVARALVATGEPFILVVVTRELEAFTVGAQQLAALRTLEASETISLDSMNPDDILSLLSARLGLAPDGLPREIGDFVNQRCGGNPFFAEELLFALREQGLLTVEPGTPYNRCVVQGNFTRASQTLPDTLHGLLLARIDHLPADHKLTLKVAAVIGRTFAYPPLQYILSSYATIVEKSLQEQLSTLIERDFTALQSREPDISYLDC